MNKKKRGRKFSRKIGPRKALIISLARALLLHEKIQTTEAKAKEASRFFEKLVTKAKRRTVPMHREILRYFEPALAKKMLEDVAPRYRERQGGYTRILKLGPRKSDGARMAIVELVK